MSSINESIRDWITANQADFSSLSGVTVSTGGEADDLEPPFVGVFETGADAYEQDSTTLYGVTTYEVTVEFHTVPVSSADGGTDADDAQDARRDLYHILGDRAAIDFAATRNEWTVFDIRLGGPTNEANEGRRITRWTLTVIAAPN